MADASASQDAAPFDIEGLYEMYGKDTVTELLQMSVDEARGLMDQISAGALEKDSKIVMAAAHQLKGLSSTMTIDELARLSFELEAAARQEGWDTIPETIERLNSELERVAKHVAEVLA